MAYKVKKSKQAKKFLDKTNKGIKKSYDEWEKDELSKNPLKCHDGLVKKFTKEKVYKKRFRTVRVLYTIKDKEVLVFKADNRGGVY